MSTLDPNRFDPSIIQPRIPSKNRGLGPRRNVFILILSLVTVAGAGTWLWAQGGQGSSFPGPQPSFGALQASPPNFVFNTPTTVTFAIQIDSPTLNPTTVELQRVDATGNLLNGVGPMYDNGQSGDSKPGDRIFTRV